MNIEHACAVAMGNVKRHIDMIAAQHLSEMRTQSAPIEMQGNFNDGRGASWNSALVSQLNALNWVGLDVARAKKQPMSAITGADLAT